MLQRFRWGRGSVEALEVAVVFIVIDAVALPPFDNFILAGFSVQVGRL
jgi:hypothetical protein